MNLFWHAKLMLYYLYVCNHSQINEHGMWQFNRKYFNTTKIYVSRSQQKSHMETLTDHEGNDGGSASRGVGRPPWDTVNKWAVRILLECILVSDESKIKLTSCWMTWGMYVQRFFGKSEGFLSLIHAWTNKLHCTSACTLPDIARNIIHSISFHMHDIISVKPDHFTDAVVRTFLT